ncbi:MAG: NAD-dependent epimerase/dehydratase family protein, partial [Pirellula sp.]
MRVVITGGGGFLGHQLCEALLARKSLIGQDRQVQAIEEIVLLDAAFPRPLIPNSQSIRIEQIVGSIESQDAIDAAVGQRSDTSIFHLASMVSGECEERFDEAMCVNLHGGLRLLETARRLGPTCRFVFA